MAFNPAVQQKMDQAADEALAAWKDLMALIDDQGDLLTGTAVRDKVLDWLKAHWYGAGYTRITKIMLSKDFREGRGR